MMRGAPRVSTRAPRTCGLALGFYYKETGDYEKGAEFNVNARALASHHLNADLPNLDRDIRRKPKDLSLRDRRAQLLLNAGQASMALEDIGHVLEKQPDSTAAHLLKVDALRRIDRGVEARQIVRDLAGRYPDNGDVLQQVGQIQMEDGHYEAAIATFDKILRKQPNYEAARDSRTLCYKRLQKQPQS